MGLRRTIFIFLSLALAVEGSHHFHDQYNKLWEAESSDTGSKFSRLERELEVLAEQPYFARVNNRTVVAPGEVAYLPCRVKSSQEGYMVTWLRTMDSTVLSVGADTFSSDTRLAVVHVARPQINADDWTLIINRTGREDEGRYECSVNTLPKISHSVDLVLDTMEEDADRAMMDSSFQFPAASSLQARIQGPRTQYVSEGSTVALHCSIPHVSQPPVALYWTRDGHVFTAKDRPGISLESEKVVSVSSSKLFISHVRLGDSANYSCVSDIARPDSIQLVVTQGATTQYKHNCPRLDPWLGLFHLLRVTFQFPPR